MTETELHKLTNETEELFYKSEALEYQADLIDKLALKRKANIKTFKEFLKYAYENDKCILESFLKIIDEKWSVNFVIVDSQTNYIDCLIKETRHIIKMNYRKDIMPWLRDTVLPYLFNKHNMIKENLNKTKNAITNERNNIKEREK